MEEDFYLDEKNSEKIIADQEFSKLESQFLQLGFREAMLNDIDHDENEMKSGFKNGFESNLQEGFLLGMIDYLKFTCVKWNFEDLKALLEKSKNILEVKQIRDNILMRIINNK